jgi:hypothetical protein
MRFDYFNDADAEYGAWTREELEAMDVRFVAALERAFELGLESRESARREVKLPSHSPRWSTPLCATVLDGLLRSAAASALVVVVRR